MHMRLAWFAAAWLAGIIVAAMFPVAWPFALALGTATLAVAALLRDARLALFALALPAVMLAGMAREHAAQPVLADDAVAHFNDGVSMRIRGVVRDDPDGGETSQRFVVDVRDVERAGVWEEASGGVLVRTPLLPRYEAGDVVELEGALESPPELERFDYTGHLARRGIGSVMDYPSARVVGEEDLGVVRETTLRVRRALSRGLGLALTEPQASLAQGVLLGERSALPADVEADLNATSTSHMVVVSGQNIVLVSSFATIALAWLVGRRRALWLSIAVVLAYAGLVGLSPPVMRATIMGVLLVIARVSGRRTHAATSIIVAAAVMAGLSPSIVRDVSFQLSFAATIGIAYVSAPVQRAALQLTGRALRTDEVPRWSRAIVFEPLGVTVAAVLATAPLLALNFGKFSLVALPANMLVVPAFPYILLASLVAAIGGCLPHTHLLLALPAHVLLSYWLAVASWLADVPGAAPGIGAFAPRLAFAAYAGLVAALLVLERAVHIGDDVQFAPSRPFPWRRAGVVARVAAPVALVTASMGFVLWPSPPARLEVTVLDVGQGDAILIETPSGFDVLVDGGPGPAVLTRVADEMPWHERSIDLVVLTHAQSDHATGLTDVMDRYDVAYVAGGGHNSLEVTRDARPLRAGDSFDLGDGVRLDVLAPTPETAAARNPNNAGVVLRLSWGDVSFLFAADIERETEDALVASGVDLRSTVLKVAHHGSATSSTRAFLDAVRPSIAVISSGEGNRYDHPSADVVARLDDYGTAYNTASDGSVRFRTDGNRLWIETTE